MFNSLHAMFMAQYTELWNAVNLIAERIRSLGHGAGFVCRVRRAGQRADAPTQPPGAGHGACWSKAMKPLARTARQHFPAVERAASDEPTADLLTQRLTVHEQTA